MTKALGLGSGINSDGYSLATDSDGNLYVGGSLSGTTASGVSISGIAKYTHCDDEANVNTDRCNTAPALTLSVSAGNPWVNSSLIAAGSVTDLDKGQTVRVEYLNPYNVWTDLAIMNTPLNNAPFSSVINVSGLADGQHTLYVRACDELDCSGELSVDFRVDNTAPTMAIDVTGGELAGDGVTFLNTSTISLSGSDTESELAGTKYVWLTGDGSGITTMIGSNSNNSGDSVGGSGFTTLANCAAALATVESYSNQSFVIPDNGQFTLCAQSHDNASNSSDISTQTFTLRSDDIIYEDGFNIILESGTASTQFQHVLSVDDGGSFTLNGILLADISAAPIEICLHFAHVNSENYPVCATVTTATLTTNYTFTIPTSILPKTQDVFISTYMTTTDLITGNTHTQPVYLILYVKRAASAINNPPVNRAYVRMSNPVFN